MLAHILPKKYSYYNSLVHCPHIFSYNPPLRSYRKSFAS